MLFALLIKLEKDTLYYCKDCDVGLCVVLCFEYCHMKTDFSNVFHVNNFSIYLQRREKDSDKAFKFQKYVFIIISYHTMILMKYFTFFYYFLKINTQITQRHKKTNTQLRG